MSGRPLFPLNPEYEDDLFRDEDAHFRRLPFHEEIPDITTDSINIAPLHWPYYRYKTCRQLMTTVGFSSFFVGSVIAGRWLAVMIYGYSVGRYRLLACEFGSGLLLSTVNMVVTAFMDPVCSPYLSGRRRPLFPEEAFRHTLNARTRLFENVHLIMHTRKEMTKYDFFRVTQEYMAKVKVGDQPGDRFRAE